MPRRTHYKVDHVAMWNPLQDRTHVMEDHVARRDQRYEDHSGHGGTLGKEKNVPSRNTRK